MLEKIRYRLVFNRQKKLNKQGTALVQVEAYLNQRKIYLKTNVYTSNRSAGAVKGHKSLTIHKLRNLTQCSMNTSCICKA